MISLDKEVEFRMYIPKEKSTGVYYGCKIEDNKFQLTCNDPFYEELSYGTIIEVEPNEMEEGVLKFKKVYKKSEYSLEVIGLPGQLNESELRSVGQMILDEGGFWEVIFGGMGYVNLPKNSTLNVIEELNILIKEKHK